MRCSATKAVPREELGGGKKERERERERERNRERGGVREEAKVIEF